MTTLPDANEREFEQFIEYINNNEIEQIKKFLSEYNNDILNRLQLGFRQPALYFAMTNLNDSQSLQMIKLLIAHNANPLYRDQNDQTILFYGCRDGKLQTCKYLINECGIKADEKDMYGQTPLFYVASQNRLNLIELFDNKGKTQHYLEDINHTDKLANQSALYYAARKGHTQMCKQLIERGANPTLLDAQGKTPAELAKKAKFSETAQFLNQEIRRIREPTVQQSVDLSAGQQSYQLGKNKKKESIPPPLNVVPRSTYKIVFMDEKGVARDLTEQQVRTMVKNNPQLENYLANPGSIPIQQLEGAQNAQTWEKAALKVLQSTMKQKGAFWFLEPVDPVKFGILDYFDIITRPMDLTTVKKKLAHNVYRDAAHFVEDMNLVWNNCYRYNGENHEISGIAKQVENFFNQETGKLGLKKWIQNQ